MFDNGEVIPGLNEDWTFAGAKMMEWVSGLVMMMLVSEILLKGNIGKEMPLLLMVWIGTTLTMATLRKNYPDEERGLANAALSQCGFHPPGIPAPAALQPVWSGAPIRGLDKNTAFLKLGFDELFPEEEEVPEDNLTGAV